jgi:hypothetical protein
VKRIVHRIAGKTEKFENRASKEEKDWLDAVQLQIWTKKDLDHLNQELSEAAKSNSELQAVCSPSTMSHKKWALAVLTTRAPFLIEEC